MTQKELDNINDSISSLGIKLSFLETELDGPIEKSNLMSTYDIEIVEFSALPVAYFLRRPVREAIKQEVLNDILEGIPIPSGVNLRGIETNNEQTKGPNRKSKPLSKPTGARGPRASVKATRSKPNSGRKNTVSGADAEGPKSERPKEKGVGEK